MFEQELIKKMMVTSKAVCLINGQVAKRSEDVCVERVIHLFLNDKPLGHLVASPSQLKELGIGFVVSEGIAQDIWDVRISGDKIYIYANDTRIPRKLVTGSSGGISAKNFRSNIDSKLIIDRQDVFTVIDEIVSELWEKTGGAHCSVLYSNGHVVAKSSDVGRHNTVDKVIGCCILNKTDLSSCVLGCTGRQPAGMVSKAINAGIPIVVSKAATTDEGIKFARKAGLTLVCRVQGDRFCVHAHPERIRGILTGDLS
jgi:FdhD protein